MTSVWSTWIAELKNSIQKPGAVPRTRRRLPAQPRPPFNMLLKAAVFSWASSGLVVGLVRLVAIPPYNITAPIYMVLMIIEIADIISKIILIKCDISRVMLEVLLYEDFHRINIRKAELLTID